jgi:hypothetical protein
MKAGLVASLLNLLIVGALLVDPKSHQLQPHALMWIGGNFGASIVLGLIGGLIAIGVHARNRRASTGTAAF